MSGSKYRRKDTNFEIVCRNCGKAATVHSRRAVYCCKACKVAWENRHRPSASAAPDEIECLVCGRKFKPFSVRTRFCTKECNRLYFQLQRAARKTARNRARIGGDRQCLFCGRTFTPYTDRHVCCSAGCYSNWKLAQKLTGGDTVEARVAYVSAWHKCPECGKIFMPRNVRQYCCSTKCGARHRAKKYYREGAAPGGKRAGGKSLKDRALEFAIQVTSERLAGIPEFERVAMMSDRERLAAMEGWSEAKRRQFYARYRRKARRGCSMDIGAMHANRMRRKDAALRGTGGAGWLRTPARTIP